MSEERRLPPALPCTPLVLDSSRLGRIAVYRDGPEVTSHAPLLLVHTVSAASSAFDMHTLFAHYARSRPTYAFDLPGFGLSSRGPGPYTPRLMTDALARVTEEIVSRHGPGPIDVLGASLGCEFVARAAMEAPSAYRSVALVSPTGFNGKRRQDGPFGSTRAVPGLHAVLAFPLWSRRLFDLLTRPKTVRYYLAKTFGSPTIDEALFAYDVLSARQPGAQHAPLYFLSAHLFSHDINRVYEALEMDVWMSHGVRGDFVDYARAETMRARNNWSFDVFQTGALPHLEVPEAFIATYDAFLTNVRARASGAPPSAR